MSARRPSITLDTLVGDALQAIGESPHLVELYAPDSQLTESPADANQPAGEEEPEETIPETPPQPSPEPRPRTPIAITDRPLATPPLKSTHYLRQIDFASFARVCTNIMPGEQDMWPLTQRQGPEMCQVCGKELIYCYAPPYFFTVEIWAQGDHGDRDLDLIDTYVLNPWICLQGIGKCFSYFNAMAREQFVRGFGDYHWSRYKTRVAGMAIIRGFRTDKWLDYRLGMNPTCEVRTSFHFNSSTKANFKREQERVLEKELWLGDSEKEQLAKRYKLSREDKLAMEIIADMTDEELAPRA